jgi:glycosyltransferase involved in cell wall biosynthesis
MIVVHVGPPTGRLGGPPGYLHQLKTAASTDPHPRHDVRFPATSSGPRPSLTPSPTISTFTRIQRKLFGPKFYRPSPSEMSRAGGVVDRMLREMAADLRADVEPSLMHALAEADVIFTHDTFSAEDALAQRRRGQHVWMMCHGVTPIALYAAWSWALPEADWRTLMDLADVQSWTAWELDVWRRVDRFILPCAEAADSFLSIDARLTAAFDRAEYILSGASTPPAQSADAFSGDDLGAQDGHTRVGLYLGSPEPYRGFDALMAGVNRLSRDANVLIAVAGPAPDKVPAHPKVRALGRVDDVAPLLDAVDFLINVNRFSLFDLSTIEATQAGKPLLLHAVGGNRAFQRLGAGCVMLDDLEPDTIANRLSSMAAMDDASLVALGRRSRACWETLLTPRHMWERHLAFYDTVSGVEA